MSRVGFTTTIPVEILIAAGKIPVDLNNIFITSDRSGQLIEEAEVAGFPRNVCGWIKGIYATVLESGIGEMIAVTEGDCSYTKALMEVLSMAGIRVVPFAYPIDRNPQSLKAEMEKLMDHFGVGWPEVNSAKERLDAIRRKVREIDRLTWQENKVTGEENHYFQVCTSDFNSDPEAFEKAVDAFLGEQQPDEVSADRLDSPTWGCRRSSASFTLFWKRLAPGLCLMKHSANSPCPMRPRTL